VDDDQRAATSFGGPRATRCDGLCRVEQGTGQTVGSRSDMDLQLGAGWFIEVQKTELETETWD